MVFHQSNARGVCGENNILSLFHRVTPPFKSLWYADPFSSEATLFLSFLFLYISLIFLSKLNCIAIYSYSKL